MKVSTTETPGFRPVELKLTFETETELAEFYREVFRADQRAGTRSALAPIWHRLFAEDLMSVARANNVLGIEED